MTEKVAGKAVSVQILPVSNGIELKYS